MKRRCVVCDKGGKRVCDARVNDVLCGVGLCLGHTTQVEAHVPRGQNGQNGDVWHFTLDYCPKHTHLARRQQRGAA